MVDERDGTVTFETLDFKVLVEDVPQDEDKYDR